jgi:hypothetical protein
MYEFSDPPATIFQRNIYLDNWKKYDNKKRTKKLILIHILIRILILILIHRQQARSLYCLLDRLLSKYSLKPGS